MVTGHVAGAEAEASTLWPPDAKSWLTGKYPNAEKTWEQKNRGQQRMRWLDGIIDSLNGHESELTPGDSEEQGSLSCYSPWGCKELDTTQRVNNIWWYILASPDLRFLALEKQSSRLPWCPVIKNLPANEGNTGLVPGPGRFYLLQQGN